MPVLLGAAMLVGGANLAAYAADGHPVLLGHSNRESTTTVVTNTGKGAALSLRTSKKSPPLSVSSSKLVKHLNADKLEGQSAASLQTTVTKYVIPGDGTTTTYSLAGLKPGNYIANVDVGVTTTSAGNPFCWLYDPNVPVIIASFQTQDPGGTIVLSGSSTIKWAGGSKALQILCPGAPIYQSSTGTLPNTVSFTRIDKLSKGTPTASKVAPKARNSLGR